MATVPQPAEDPGRPVSDMDESALEREERMDLALRSAEVGTWNWRVITNFIVWDAVMHRLFGVEPDDFRKNYDGFASLVHPADRERIRGEVMASLEKGVQFSSQYRVIWPKDGSQHWIAARGKVYRDACGHPIRMTGVCWDITEQKTLAEELERRAAELERSNRELEQFAYVASHDLQEPLRMVRSYLQLIEKRYKGQLDAQADEFISFAVDGAARMSSLVRDLLTYSRIGTRRASVEPVDMAKCIRQAQEDLKVAIAEKNASIATDPMPVIEADPGQMTQLFQNLIGNGIKFCASAVPRINISARRGFGEWTFSVADNGIGIEPQYLDRIFVIFQRLHTRDEYPGTGIGLAICKKIVEGRGGRIWVESEPGRGTTFLFSIPDQHDGRFSETIASPSETR